MYRPWGRCSRWVHSAPIGQTSLRSPVLCWTRESVLTAHLNLHRLGGNDIHRSSDWSDNPRHSDRRHAHARHRTIKSISGRSFPTFSPSPLPCAFLFCATRNAPRGSNSPLCATAPLSRRSRENRLLATAGTSSNTLDACPPPLDAISPSSLPCTDLALRANRRDSIRADCVDEYGPRDDGVDRHRCARGGRAGASAL